MKIVLATSGSRGDTQPYIAVGLELKNRGHDVTIAVEERLKPLVDEFGLKHFTIAGDPTGLIFEKENQQMLRDNKIMQVMKKTQEHNDKFYAQALDTYEKACEGADLIISGPLCMTQTWCVAEKNKQMWMPLALGPTLETGAFPLFFISQTNLGSFLNKMTYKLMFWMLWNQEKGKINQWRTTKLGLPPMTQQPAKLMMSKEVPIMIACSPSFVPGGKVPADYPSNVHVPGFAYVPEANEEEVDPKLKEFLAAGEKPVYLGFGSMPAPDPKELVRTAVHVVKTLKCRAVLCAGWSEIEASGVEVPPELLIIKAAPHDYLFPRCAAIVHHCGVGTVAAALRSGVPQVPCWVMLDQPFNASRVHQMGLATEPLPFHKLTPETLTERIRVALNDKSMQTKAQEEAAVIARENGAKACADIIEKGHDMKW